MSEFEKYMRKVHGSKWEDKSYSPNAMEFAFEAGKQSALNRKCVWTPIKHTNGAFSTNCGYKICGSTGVYCDKCGGKIEIKETE